MTSPIAAPGLLKTAHMLAGSNAGAGRPALSDLRRATSTAYYALFHQIVRHGCLDFLPDAGEAEVAEVARWFSHIGIRRASAAVSLAASTRPLTHIPKDQRGPVIALRTTQGAGSFSSRALAVADAFQVLQDARHRADYDGTYDPYRAVTVNHVNAAEAAVQVTWWLWRSQWSTRTGRQTEFATYRCMLRLALIFSGGPRSR